MLPATNYSNKMRSPFFRISIFLFFFFWPDHSTAQNPYLGLWEGFLIAQCTDGTIQKSRIQLYFHSAKLDTLIVNVIEFKPEDSTQVSTVYQNLKGIYRKDDRSLYCEGRHRNTRQHYLMSGKLNLQFADINKNIIVGSFISKDMTWRGPKVDAHFERKKADLVKQSFIKTFNAHLDERKKKKLDYENCQCDDKVYTVSNRSIREFSSLTSTTPEPSIIHENVLPFNSVALAKGFNNILYSVSEKNYRLRQLVYWYNPLSQKGGYTEWALPNNENNSPIRWLSGGTDPKGNIYFMSELAEKLVRINPGTNEITTIWNKSPFGSIPGNPYLYSESTFGNFCFDEKGYMYIITGSKGNILKVAIQGESSRIINAYSIANFPGFSGASNFGDILIQKNELGVNRMYAAASRVIIEIDLERKIINTPSSDQAFDLAGCNIFRKTAAPLVQEAKSAIPPTSIPTLPLDPVQPVNPITEPATSLTTAAKVKETPTILNISFKQSKAEFLTPADAYQELNQWIERMKIYPSMTIKITGYTDNQGPKENNIRLSENRAIRIKKYFIENGILGSRITSLGKGPAMPRASNSTEEGRKENRRVEITVTSN